MMVIYTIDSSSFAYGINQEMCFGFYRRVASAEW